MKFRKWSVFLFLLIISVSVDLYKCLVIAKYILKETYLLHIQWCHFFSVKEVQHFYTAQGQREVADGGGRI